MKNMTSTPAAKIATTAAAAVAKTTPPTPPQHGKSNTPPPPPIPSKLLAGLAWSLKLAFVMLNSMNNFVSINLSDKRCIEYSKKICTD